MSWGRRAAALIPLEETLIGWPLEQNDWAQPRIPTSYLPCSLNKNEDLAFWASLLSRTSVREKKEIKPPMGWDEIFSILIILTSRSTGATAVPSCKARFINTLYQWLHKTSCMLCMPILGLGIAHSTGEKTVC